MIRRLTKNRPKTRLFTIILVRYIIRSKHCHAHQRVVLSSRTLPTDHFQACARFYREQGSLFFLCTKKSKTSSSLGNRHAIVQLHTCAQQCEIRGLIELTCATSLASAINGFAGPIKWSISVRIQRLLSPVS